MMKLLLLSSWLWLAMAVAAEEPKDAAGHSRELSTCAPFQACFLRNLETGKEVMMFTERPTAYNLPNAKGFNVHCEVSRELGAISVFDFTYGGQTVSHPDVSGWMDGIGPLPGQGATTCKAVPWFNRCGSKTFTVKGSWNGQTCFTHTYTLTTATCPPTRAPTKAPTKRPTKRPTRTPTKRPTPRPTRAPTKRPTGRPTTRPPTRRPTPAPVRQPTKPPTRRPTRSPTRRPTRQPTKAPIDPCPGAKLHSVYRTCIPNDCDANWVCPANAKPRTDVNCVDAINDCTCDQGYMKAPNNEVKCVLDPNNCRSGYTMRSGFCVPNTCTSQYVCPSNSSPKQECMRDLNDCTCAKSYRKVGSSCVYNPCGDGKKQLEIDGKPVVPMVCYAEDCTSKFICPANSVPNHECPWDIWRCDCSAGYRRNDEGKGCELNPCGKDMKLRNGRCVPHWCSSLYQCPEFSKVKIQFNTTCIDNIDHCQCNDSYEVTNGKCVHNPCGSGFKASPSGDGRCVPTGCDSQFKCPKDSVIKTGNERACITDINQCTCNTGFKVVGGRCVPNECSNTVYNCPAYSTQDTTRKCCSSISDCVCQSGYKVSGDRCVECGANRKILNGVCVPENCNGSFICPSNSQKKQDCCSSISDCKCNDYFKLSGDTCVHDPNWCPSGKKMMNGHCCAESCTSTYQCPANSEIDKSKDCIKTILDCKCINGFTVSNGSCIPDPCTAKKSDTKTGADGRCVPSWCSSTFVCPANSIVSPDMANGCIDNIWHCQCNKDYSLNKDNTACTYNPCGKDMKWHPDGRCVENWCDSYYTCPQNSTLPKRKEKSCIYNIWDCECDKDHTMTSDQKRCEYNPCGKDMKLHTDGRCTENWCDSNYQCPKNSKIKSSKQRSCLYTIWDCDCDANHTMTSDQKNCEYNPCGNDMKVHTDGRCTENWCTSSYKCPKYSSILKNKQRSCIWGIGDCECHYGYKKDGDKCVPDGVVCPKGRKLINGHCSSDSCDSDYICPANSKLNPSMNCISEFDDCTCDDGYKKDNDKCVWDSTCGVGKKMIGGRCMPVDCISTYKCPENSKIKDNKATECIKDVNDCVCNSRFRVENNVCVANSCQDNFKPFGSRCIPETCTSTYTCPGNAIPAAGKETACITSLSDCVCRSGYRLENGACNLNPCGDGKKSQGGRCVPEDCKGLFSCPSNSTIREEKRLSCLESMSDCVCNPEYRREGNACLFNPCGNGFKPVDKRCVPETCTSTYTCPANAIEAPGKKTSCITSVSDCVCVSGFRMDNGVCVVNVCRDGFKPMGVNGRCIPETCMSTFMCPANSIVIKSREQICDITVADCACVSRFRKENDVCVPNSCDDGFKPRGDRCIPEDCTSTFTCPANSRVIEEKKKACINEISSCACLSRFRMENGVCVANTCQDGFKLVGGRCVPESCQSTYTCPENFMIIKNKESDCITDVSSCVCKTNYRLENDKCVFNSCGDGWKPLGERCVPTSCTSTFSCPVNSVPLTGKEKSCLTGMSECKCLSGFRLENGACVVNPCGDGMKTMDGRCVPETCTSTFKCPAKSVTVAGKERACLSDIKDCVCESGFRLENGACVLNPCGDGFKSLLERCVPDTCASTYRCPANSNVASGNERKCLNNIFDCACNAGFKMVGDACVPDGSCSPGFKMVANFCVPDTCTSTFTCPVGSTVAPSKERACITSMSDCVCNFGFRRIDNTCVANPCGSGMMPQGDRCVPDWCKSTYTCPVNSKPVGGKERDCLYDFGDCTCNLNHVWTNGACLYNPCGTGKKSVDGRCVPDYCTSTFKCPANSVISAKQENGCLEGAWDCVCKAGFRMENGVCVANTCGDGMKPMGSRCVPEACTSTFTCPANSVIASGRDKDCLYNVWDCMCNKGYRMSGGACIINTCSDGQKLLEGRCVPDWCTSSYTCPVNSSPLPGKECLRNSLDCVCSNDYKMTNGVCVYDPCGTGQKMVSGGGCVPTTCSSALKCPARAQSLTDCVTDIAVDCVCEAGYQMTKGQCVLKPNPPQCSCNCALDAVNDTCVSPFKESALLPPPVKESISGSAFGNTKL